VGWWQLRNRNADLERELRADLELEEEEQRERGVSSEEARYAARRALGNTTLIREQVHAIWSWSMVENLLRDARIGVRALFRSPGFSIIAVVVMALCIGATTCLFTVVRSVLLKPLPFRDPDRLVMLYEHFRDPSMNAEQFNYNSVAPGDYYDWRAKTNGFEDMAAWRYWQFNLTGERDDLPEMVNAGRGTSNLFPLLGVQPVVGRWFNESEDRTDGSVVMLTWSIFKRRFGGDASIVGRQIHLDGKPFTVIGVLPAWFAYPDAKVQLWVPFRVGLPAESLQYHDHHYCRVVARLRPNVSLSSALGQVGAVQYQEHLQYLHEPVAEGVAPRTISDDLAKNVKKPLMVLLCAVGCVLLIGCLNVANLMVARSAARQKDIAVRQAMGAGRVTLIREQQVESLLLSVAGGAMGVLFSVAATQWLVRAWRDLPSVQSIHPDGVVIGFACVVVFAVALLAGMVSALASIDKGALAALQASSRSAAGSRSRTTLRKALLATEIATTVVLLIAAGLLLKSFWRLRGTEIGCATDNVLTMVYSLPAKKYDSPAKVNAFNETLLERVRSMPGVRSAALGSIPPGGGFGGDDTFTILEHSPIPAGQALPSALYRRADPGYFSALQIPLVSGRFFTSADRAGRPKTIIISRMLAQQYFPGENPVGKHLHVGAESDEDFQVIGVVADTVYQVGKPLTPTFYFPVLSGGSDEALTLVVRTSSEPLAFSVPVQKLIADLDPELPVSDVMTLQQLAAQFLDNASLSAGMVLAFAVLSLVLAFVGLYGVLSYLATQRTSEIGIRIALGARREQVFGLMLADGVRPAVIGLCLGLAASVATVRVIGSMLYRTEALDPAVFAGVAGLLLIVAIGACLVPAVRAARLDPMQALRNE
jgi:putative ABC transport system permease protein